MYVCMYVRVVWCGGCIRLKGQELEVVGGRARLCSKRIVGKFDEDIKSVKSEIC